MPALITHHLFGEHSANLLPAGVINDEEELLAFLLGNQGPDPFFFRFAGLPAHVAASQRLAHRMHDERMTAAFSALRDGVSHLPAHDAGIGRAFALGMLSHYALDRHAHPFIYAQEYALVDANPQLGDAGGEVHAVIESDIDTWMLWSLRRATVHDCPPAAELARTERICRVAGALMSQVAWAAFSLDVPATEYGDAVANMELVYRLIEPAGSTGARLVGSLERLGRAHSQIQALSHRVSTSDECPAANLEHNDWVSPFTGKRSTKSFKDLFDEALVGWPRLASAFTHGGDDLRQAIVSLNYSGQPLGEAEKPSE